jgi:hypothetical protein
MNTPQEQHSQQHDELKARLYAIEQALAVVAQILHALHKGDVKLGGDATQKLIEKVKTMPGGSGIL